MKRSCAFVLLLLATISAMGAQRRKAPPSKIPAPLAYDMTVVNDPAAQCDITLDAKGDVVLRAQILLDRAHFSVGQIDGHFGKAMADTVRAYQAARRLQPDGVVKAEMWQALHADTAPALVDYTITPQDAAGPFVPIPSDVEAKAKLPFAGYQTALEALGERFHASPRLLQILNPGRNFGRAGEQIVVPNVNRGPLSQPAALIVIRRACSCLEVLDANDSVIAHYPATLGSSHDPLPIGEWKIGKPIQNPVFHYNPKLFWDAKANDPSTTIKPGPNNPVGLNWIPLSKDHYGIHGTPDPASIGRAQSHGCIRLTNWDVSELAMLVTPGMTASLREQ